MTNPQLLLLGSPEEYRKHFEDNYCSKDIYTFDSIRVFFPRGAFDHAFYKSSSRRRKNKDVFANDRAERMDWIKPALEDKNADLYYGWDNKKKRISNNRRVVLVVSNYIVVIQLQKEKKANFVTAFVADPYTLNKIKQGKKWA